MTHHLTVVGEPPNGRQHPKPLVAAGTRAAHHGGFYMAAGRVVAERLGIPGPTPQNVRYWLEVTS